MAERATVTTVTQIGVESTAGTAVAANRKLSATSIDISPSVDFDKFTPAGSKYETLSQPTMEFVEGSIEGRVAFNDLAYLLSGLLTTSAAVTQIMDSATPTGGYTWSFTPSSSADDTPKTFTIERGNAVRAHRAPFGMINELTLNFDRGGAPTVGGSVIAAALEDGVTLTSSPTSVLPVPALITGVDVYMDATSGALGTTKLARLRSAEWTLGDRFNPVWVIDSSKTSFVDKVEGQPSATFGITAEADAQGMGLLTTMRAGTTKFIRLKCTGPNIYTGGVTVNHSLTIDMACKVGDTGSFDDDDGLQVFDWTFDLVHDTTWGKALTVTLINTLSAL